MAGAAMRRFFDSETDFSGFELRTAATMRLQFVGNPFHFAPLSEEATARLREWYEEIFAPHSVFRLKASMWFKRQSIRGPQTTAHLAAPVPRRRRRWRVRP